MKLFSATRSLLCVLLAAGFLHLSAPPAKADVWQWIGVPDGFVNDSYDIIFPWENGPFSWTLLPLSDEIPPGLSFSNFQDAGFYGLELSGTPTQEGTYDIQMVVTKSGGQTDTWLFTIIIKPEYVMSINPTKAFLTRGRVNQAYSTVFTVSGGQAPYTWSTDGNEPTGLSLSPTTGTLSGTPTVEGEYLFKVSVKDGIGMTKSRQYTLVISDDPYITTSTPLESALVNSAYSLQLDGTGGSAPYTYALSAGILPAGLSLSSTGLISGTPTSTGTYTFSVTIADSSSPAKSSTQKLTLSVLSLDISPKSLPDGTQGISYPSSGNLGDTTLTVTGGRAPYRFAVTKGKIPAGIRWEINGATITFKGYPRAGSADFTLRFSDARGEKGEQKYSFTIAAPGAPTISTGAALPDGKVGTSYSTTLQATGAPGPHIWRLKSASSVPPGIFVSPSGVISGTPKVAGTYSFEVKVTANNRKTASKTFTLTIAP